MPRIGLFEFTGWQGAVLMPTAKGSRPSQIRTSALVKDAVDAWLLTTQYTALVGAGGSNEVETLGGTIITGVRVARVTITNVRKARMRGDGVDPLTYQVDATWELHV
ncbi:MAG TPA: hypothetical protein VHX44_10950 [Planctomycetota bacterium]|nr:hypothetical protein [Planctomycetota bacterium]